MNEKNKYKVSVLIKLYRIETVEAFSKKEAKEIAEDIYIREFTKYIPSDDWYDGLENVIKATKVKVVE